MSTANGFKTEAQLVRYGRRLIRGALEELDISARVRYEVRAPGGVPDLVLFNKSSDRLSYVVTVEFKISAWRRALQQSFKTRNYGNEAYVVLDAAHVGAALDHYHLFEQANVGLLSVAPNASLDVWYYPQPHLPFSLEFSKALAHALFAPRGTLPNDLPFTRSLRGGIALAGLRKIWGTPDADSTLGKRVPVS